MSGSGVRGMGLPPVEKVREEVDRLWQTARATGERAMGALGLAGQRGVPNVDLYESETTVEVFVDLPGVAAESVELSLDGQTLSLRARRPENMVIPGGRYVLMERPHEPFERTIPILVAVDRDHVQAVMRNGQLQVTLKRVQQPGGQPIPVRAGGMDAASTAL